MELAKVYLSCEDIKISGQVVSKEDTNSERRLLVLAYRGEMGDIYPVACVFSKQCIGETVCGFYEGHKESIAGNVIVRCGGGHSALL